MSQLGGGQVSEGPSHIWGDGSQGHGNSCPEDALPCWEAQPGTDGNMRTLSDMGGHSGVRIMRLGLVPLNHLLSDRISGKEIVGPGVFWGLRGDFSLQPSLRTTAQRNEGVMSTLAAAFLQTKPRATHLFQAAGTTCWSSVGSGAPAAQTGT